MRKAIDVPVTAEAVICRNYGESMKDSPIFSKPIIMKQYISEARAAYEDMYHGLFSRKLAEWAVSRMRMKDTATKQMRPIPHVGVEEVQSMLRENEVELPEEFVYTAYYLYNMAVADYPKTLQSDEQKARFVEETLCDPDGMPENVLDCFEVKMCNAGMPIYWERFL